MGVDEFRCRYDLFSCPDEPHNKEGKEILERTILDYPSLPMNVSRPQCTRRCPSRLHWFNLFLNDQGIIDSLCSSFSSKIELPPTSIIAEEY